VLIAPTIILCAVVFSSKAAFAFAKLRFPFKGVLFDGPRAQPRAAEKRPGRIDEAAAEALYRSILQA
jgi:hypothetical protein